MPLLSQCDDMTSSADHERATVKIVGINGLATAVGMACDEAFLIERQLAFRMVYTRIE